MSPLSKKTALFRMQPFTDKIGLGTVQFGLNYGISNQTGKPADESVRNILAEAYESGIRTIDSATLYGDSETVIGRNLSDKHNFQIVTKTPHFAEERLTSIDGKLLVESFHQSLRNLKTKSCYGLLIHAPTDLLKPGAIHLIDAMSGLK
ncbi:MAG: hypothetical protein EOP04_15005, partial [Proteobacteria bacterium]